jgi:hypothetical protein
MILLVGLLITGTRFVIVFFKSLRTRLIGKTKLFSFIQKSRWIFVSYSVWLAFFLLYEISNYHSVLVLDLLVITVGIGTRYQPDLVASIQGIVAHSTCIMAKLFDEKLSMLWNPIYI